MIYESVINISQGRDQEVLELLKSKVKNVLLDVHTDFDHNRSVFTLGSYELKTLVSKTKNLVDCSLSILDSTNHEGVHPRHGIVDVVPFISYESNSLQPTKQTILQAQDFGDLISREHEINVYFYDYANSKRRSLPSTRKSIRNSEPPDISSNFSTNKLNNICIGAREPLVAINVNAFTRDIDACTAIAESIRESTGGVKGVRALGFELKSKNQSQVSMNITDLKSANTGEVCLKVRDMLIELKIESEIDLVGLIPEFHFKTLSKEFLDWAKLDETYTVEYRLDESS